MKKVGEVEKKVFEYMSNNPGSVAWRVRKHSAVIEKHINPEEEVLFAFVGQKNENFYDLFTTCVVALTNKRIIVAQKRVLWGYFLKSITAEMFNDLSVYQGLIWGKVTIDTIKEEVVITNVSKLGLDDIETNITMHMIKAKKVSQKSKKNEK